MWPLLNRKKRFSETQNLVHTQFSLCCLAYTGTSCPLCSPVFGWSQSVELCEAVCSLHPWHWKGAALIHTTLSTFHSHFSLAASIFPTSFFHFFLYRHLLCNFYPSLYKFLWTMMSLKCNKGEQVSVNGFLFLSFYYSAAAAPHLDFFFLVSSVLMLSSSLTCSPCSPISPTFHSPSPCSLLMLSRSTRPLGSL